MAVIGIQQIIDLLARLKAELHMSYLFITHDLSTARSLCSRTIVLGSLMACESVIASVCEEERATRV